MKNGDARVRNAARMKGGCTVITAMMSNDERYEKAQ